ncbi:MAG: sigma-54 dependent transcriptional regulator, partial [Planctomycetota bacterium]|nr:sigma-54 dependent transcriptional regulator [Planctomycetota bacterium]
PIMSAETFTMPAEELIGVSPAIQQLRERVTMVAGFDVNLLLQGESGTGKELVSRMVHSLSDRRDGPFVGVNCAAIHETLLESELFGHQAGAFTGARHSTLGFLRASDSGTILLDEIGDMSESLQAKLLRVLEQRSVIPVGATRPIPIDIRVIAATHCDLAKAVHDGSFRRDLYYRLNVVRLTIAPLRDRRDDIPLLAEHMSRKMAGMLHMPVKKISQPAMDTLIRYDWPGNVRELGNVIQRAYVLGCEPVIEIEDLSEDLFDKCGKTAADTFPTLQEVTHDHVMRALESANGVRSRAARMLGIDRKSLWRMLHRDAAGNQNAGR